jgi:late competence protein required for DNA uptake (superfamily II DNA/RNA helicase)
MAFFTCERCEKENISVSEMYISDDKVYCEDCAKEN